jgi:V/A-type H+-transporting ATPase subunit A
MLKRLVRFIALAEAALQRGVALQAIAELPVLRGLQRMGEEIGEDQLQKFDELGASIEAAMAGLGKASPHAA